MNPLGPVAVPLALAYALGTRLFRQSYESGYRSRWAASKPVLCVGNIEAGGTGKTPLVLSLCRWFLSRGVRPGIVSRGYGRKNPGRASLVSLGEGALIPPEDSGDEPALYTSRYPEIPVAVSGDRREGIAMIKDLCDLILLDDGFQSLEVLPTASLVFLPAFLSDRPPTLSDLLPAGILREPVDVLGRATHWIMTSCGDALRDEERSEKARINLIRFVGPEGCRPILLQRYRLTCVEDFSGRGIFMPGELPGLKAALVLGIANPHRVEEMLREHGMEITGVLSLSDHAVYSQKIWRRVEEFARVMKERGASILLTTEKDRVKWEPPPRLEIPTGILRGEADFIDPLRWDSLLTPLCPTRNHGR